MNGATEAHIRAAAERLRAGGVVAFPTETVYGLGADALNADAVRRVFALKGRPSNNPLIVHVADVAMAKRVASVWPAKAGELAASCWPGPLTMVLPKAADVPDVVTAGGATVGVRCPDHPVALALIREFGGPIVGPSANPSGRISPTTAAHVRAAFADEEVMVLDGGPSRRGIESTVVSLVGADAERPRVLRMGVLTAERIGATVSPGGSAQMNNEALPSPGMLPMHYSPRTRMVLFDGAEWEQIAARARAMKGGIAVLAIGEGLSLALPSVVVRMPRDAEAYAARLYAALHEADAMRKELIAVERPAFTGGVWDAIRDRLARAANQSPMAAP
ncbi:MAG TPA: L-threonylcarbamoyladenylate synthase [Phycisphaerales bacterium]|nr:L-threonylcarbamoyladenylate synthase [Phycisphaerales bacterium]